MYTDNIESNILVCVTRDKKVIVSFIEFALIMYESSTNMIVTFHTLLELYVSLNLEDRDWSVIEELIFMKKRPLSNHTEKVVKWFD